jgi:ABC-type nitrate/sulfonate/bicarbonate transport system substrate-binding protein
MRRIKNGASEMNQLKICTFKGLQNLSLYIARQQGFFAAQGLDIEITYTAGSLPQLAGLAREEYQLIQTAPDNVINVDNNPAAFGLDPATAPHIIMLLGGSVGSLPRSSLVSLTRKCTDIGISRFNLFWFDVVIVLFY